VKFPKPSQLTVKRYKLAELIRKKWESWQPYNVTKTAMWDVEISEGGTVITHSIPQTFLTAKNLENNSIVYLLK
jgi:hypothetical protein